MKEKIKEILIKTADEEFQEILKDLWGPWAWIEIRRIVEDEIRANIPKNMVSIK